MSKRVMPHIASKVLWVPYESKLVGVYWHTFDIFLDTSAAKKQLNEHPFPEYKFIFLSFRGMQ